MENESDSYDNVRQDISLTQSMIPSDLTAHPNYIQPPVSAAPLNYIQPPVSAAPPNYIQPPVSAAPPNYIQPPVSAAPLNSIEPPVSAAPLNSIEPPNSNATVDQNETPDAPPAYYASIDPPPPYSNPSQYPPTLGIPYLQNYPRGIPATGRPPHGQHYNYPPLGFVQPQGPKPHQHQHHQQQQVQQQHQRVITLDNHCQRASVAASQSSPVSMTGAIVLACFVTWFCAYVCGLMALRMACAGRQLAEVGETIRAIRMRRASYCFSITGIIFGLIIIIVLVCVLTTSKSTSSDHQEVPTGKTNCRRVFLYYTCS